MFAFVCCFIRLLAGQCIYCGSTFLLHGYLHQQMRLQWIQKSRRKWKEKWKRLEWCNDIVTMILFDFFWTIFWLKASITLQLFSPVLILCPCPKLILLFAKFSPSKLPSYRFPKVEKLAVIWYRTEQARRMGSIRCWPHKLLLIWIFLWKE